jgi:TolB-like protein/Flp pilus assembly protein TadD
LSTFLRELKRRKVVRVGAVYTATAFVVLQGADLILPALALPDWTYRMLVLLALFGLPIALVLGWAFELTPSGVRATTPSPAAPGEPLPSLLGRRTIVVTTLLAVLGIGLGAGWMLRPAGAPRSAGGPATDDRSVAVLPFDNYSPDPADAYFANGITEEITSQLAGVSGLRVMSRTAVSRALERQGSLADIARELGVASVLEGSVRMAGDHVRITTQLIDPRSNEHLWTQHFDRELADVFAIQRDVALAIVGALRARLAPGEAERIATAPTQNLAAYQLYLRAGQLAGNVPAENKLAIELLREAVALDPQFEKAWSRLAWRYQWETFHGDDSGTARAMEFSARALELDPTSPDAHSARAATYVAMERFEDARAAFARALEINPDHNHALLDGGFTAALLGDAAKGLRLSAGALRTSPNVPNVRYHVGVPLLLMDDDARLEAWLDLAAEEGMVFHRLDALRIMLDVQRGRTADALARLRDARLRHGEHPEFALFAAHTRLFLGQPAEARAVLERAYEASPDRVGSAVTDRSPRTSLAFALLRLGELDRAAALFDEALRVNRARIDEGSGSPLRRLEIAAILALRGEHDTALKWIERAYDTGFRAHRRLRQDPMFESLRADPRFHALLERMAEANARERARVDAEGMAGVIDAMIAAGNATANRMPNGGRR